MELFPETRRDLPNSWVYKRPDISTPCFAAEQIGFEIIIFCKTDLQKYHLLGFRKKTSRTRHPSSHPHLVPMALSPHHAPILQQLSLEPWTFDPGNGIHDPCLPPIAFPLRLYTILEMIRWECQRTPFVFAVFFQDDHDRDSWLRGIIKPSSTL